MFLKILISFLIIKDIRSEEILKIKGNEMELQMLQLISGIEQSLDIQTIVIKYDTSISNCGELNLYVKQLNVTIIMENLQASWPLRESLNINILSLVCLNGLYFNYAIELKAYFHSLHTIRDTKMIFFINHNESINILPELQKFLKYCREKKSLNVVVIFKDFYRTLHLYGYKPFPEFQMIRRYFHKVAKEEIYPNNLRNLMGHDFYTLPDQIIPRTFLVDSHNGGVKISGYVGHFMHLLAEQLNATLKFPFPVKKGNVLFYGDLETLTWNNTLDLPATLAPIVNEKQMLYYSYPFHVINACLMIPVAKNMPLSHVFFYLMNFELSLISILNLYLFTLLLNWKRFKVAPKALPLPDFILNDVALRGILGQPFKVWRKAGFFTKFIYMLLSLAGLYLSLIYGAFLQSFLTRPFKQPQLRTFEDLYLNNVYALLSDNEITYFGEANINFRLLYRLASYDEFNYMRSSLNTSYTYPTINIHWKSLFHNQQSNMKDKLFMYSEDACFFTNVLMSFPMAENTFYRPAVYKLIMAAQDYGLVDHWFESNYLDMMSDGRKFLLNVSIESTEGRALTIKNLHLVFEMYVGLMILATLIFIMERIYYRLKRLKANSRCLP